MKQSETKHRQRVGREHPTPLRFLVLPDLGRKIKGYFCCPVEKSFTHQRANSARTVGALKKGKKGLKRTTTQGDLAALFSGTQKKSATIKEPGGQGKNWGGVDAREDGRGCSAKERKKRTGEGTPEGNTRHTCGKSQKTKQF